MSKPGTRELVERAKRWNRDGVPTAISPHMMIDELVREIERLSSPVREADAAQEDGSSAAGAGPFAQWVTVPIEPTEEMIRASRQALGKYIRSLSKEEREKALGYAGGFQVHDESLKARIRYQAMVQVAATLQVRSGNPRAPSTKWQPISTAPKDGTIILAWCPASEWLEQWEYEIIVSVCWRRGPFGTGWLLPWLFDQGGELVDMRQRFIEPTHWMPIPLPPLGSPS
jgi:hypothetical protein